MREASRNVSVTTNRDTWQLCILNVTVPVFTKNMSHIVSFVRFSPILLLPFLQSRPSCHRRIHSPAEKTAPEQEDVEYEPEEVDSESCTPKKGRKKKEEPDPGLTMGTDIEDYLQPEGKQVEIEVDKVRIDTEKKKGQIRWKGPKLLVKRIESLEASPPTRPIYIILWEYNSMFSAVCVCVVSHARALAHRRLYLRSQMAITGVYLDSTALKPFLPFVKSDRENAWICKTGILHVRPIF